MRVAEIECGICKRVFECVMNISPNECAEQNNMVVLSFEDLSNSGYSEQIYVCRECFDKLIFKLFQIDLFRITEKEIVASITEKEIINYFKNLDWQEQDELLRKINKVLVNKIF